MITNYYSCSIFCKERFGGTNIGDLSGHIGIALYTQRLFEGKPDPSFYKTTEKIIRQGQKEGSVISGDSRKLSEFYRGIVYLYAVKNLYQTDFAMISSADLSRLLPGDK